MPVPTNFASLEITYTTISVGSASAAGAHSNGNIAAIPMTGFICIIPSAAYTIANLTHSPNVGTNSRRDISISVAFQKHQQFALDAPDKAGPLKYKRGVKLHQRGTGPDLSIGILPRGDTAHPDQHQFLADARTHFLEHSGRGREKRRTVEHRRPLKPDARRGAHSAVTSTASALTGLIDGTSPALYRNASNRA